MDILLRLRLRSPKAWGLESEVRVLIAFDKDFTVETFPDSFRKTCLTQAVCGAEHFKRPFDNERSTNIEWTAKMNKTSEEQIRMLRAELIRERERTEERISTVLAWLEGKESWMRAESKTHSEFGQAHQLGSKIREDYCLSSSFFRGTADACRSAGEMLRGEFELAVDDRESEAA